MAETRHFLARGIQAHAPRRKTDRAPESCRRWCERRPHRERAQPPGNSERLTGTNRAVVRFYNQRGTAEQWIKEGKTATHWTRLSCHRFRANEVRLLLGVIAYNLGNLLRRLVLPVTVQDWSLTSLQQRLFKTGGRLIRQPGTSRCSSLAESYLTGPLFRQILARSSDWHGIRHDRADGAAARRVTDQWECLYGLCSRGTCVEGGTIGTLVP